MTTAEKEQNDPQAHPALPTWDMACAVLVALHQTYRQAEADYLTIRAANPDNPFAPGTGERAGLLELMGDNYLRLVNDMNKHARTCGLHMPELNG